jgi:ribose 5-phosphate isomerase B
VKVALGSDHAGYDLKEKVKGFLNGMGIEVHDAGTVSTDSVDYPDFAQKVAVQVRDGEVDRGILMCGTGVGVCIAANKFRGIRAALASDPEIARLSRQHNDANILCLASRFTDAEKAQELVKIWLETDFEGGRHQRRLEKIQKLEQER